VREEGTGGGFGEVAGARAARSGERTRTGTINSAASIASNAGDDLMFIADLTNNDWVLA
jgi:hypothetical protein